MPQSFNEQLIEFLPKMRVWALAITRDKPGAEDLVQDVATKALSAQSSFESGTNFSAWLRRIMVNHFISSVRKNRESSDIDIPEVGVSACHEDGTALGELSWAINRLPPDQRDALDMIALQEIPYETASKRTGCPIGTLKSRVHRARIQLRHFMFGEIGSQPPNWHFHNQQMKS